MTATIVPASDTGGLTSVLNPVTTRDVLGRYRHCPVATAFFLRLRWWLTPYRRVAAHLPAEGRILDLGAGHGLLALTLALQSSGREVIGVDHDAERVRLANRAATGVNNVRFLAGNFSVYLGGESRPAAGVVVLDALHYLAPPAQQRLIADCHGALAPGGVLLVREVDTTAGLTARVNRLHERVMTGVGFTRAGGLHFRTPAEWHRAFESAGFGVASEPCGSFPFADRLFVCHKD